MRRFALALALMLSASLAEGGGEPKHLAALFPKQAEVRIERPGLARVTLPAEILAACRPDLSDLRILDEAGAEVPFLVDSGPDPETRLDLVRTVVPRLLSTKVEEIRSENGPPIHRETFELETPPGLPDGGWSLELRSDRPRFVRQAAVAAIASGQATELLAAESIFRLSDPAGGIRERTTLVLPPGSADTLRITLEGRDGFYLEPGFRYLSSQSIAQPQSLLVPLEEVGRQRARGRTTIELARPRGLVPDRLRIDTSTSLFDRAVAVHDQGPGSPVAVLGEGRIVRIATAPTIEHLEIVLRPALGDRLRLEIVDGDSPPLADFRVSAQVRRPSLVFAIANGAPTRLRLLFGGGRARPPRYDLAELLPRGARMLAGERAIAAAKVYDENDLAPASLGAIVDNPGFDHAPALAFAMRPGAEIDGRRYAYRRDLAITPSPEGLARLRLSPEETAAAREDLADVRVVDGELHQWPYLLERDRVHEDVEVAVGAAVRRGKTSSFPLGLPAAALSVEEVTLETEADFVDRPFRLVTWSGAGLDRKETTLAAGRLVRRDGDHGPLTIAGGPWRRVHAIELVIEDGDEMPLVIASARVRVALPEVFLTVPAGTYRLLIGNPDDDAPRYELAQVREVVLAAAATAVPSGRLDANPDYSARARLESGGSRDTALLWVVLTVAVLALGGFTMRLARTESGTPPR
jgi:hypothetical protein